MKNLIIYSLFMMTLSIGLVGCNNDEPIDTENSIFPIDKTEPTPFDLWVMGNYTYPYNIALKYRMEDIESDMDHVLVPADLEKSMALAKIVKYVWMEAYDELMDTPNFLRKYVPKTLHFIGSPAYEDNGTMVVGTAEGGMKITLYNVNSIDFNQVDMDMLNEYYFKTMHHEFAHILHQQKNYDPAFDLITESDYIGSDWYLESDATAWSRGFVTPYAMSESREDFVEIIALYVTQTQKYWDTMLESAGDTGSTLINKKFAIVYAYMRDTWGIDLNELRKIVLRRQDELTGGAVDLSPIN